MSYMRLSGLFVKVHHERRVGLGDGLLCLSDNTIYQA